MPLQDSDNFIIGRGTDSYKITYQDLKDDLNYVPPPTGTINTPTVLEPNDGAGGGDTRYLKSDAITKVEGGGIDTCETSLIQSVDKTPPTTYDCRVLNGTFGDTPDSWDSLPPSPRYDGVAIGTKPTADTGIYMGLVYKIDVPGFIRINPNAGGADASIPVKLWSSNDGINWVGPTEVTQGNLDPSHASYDASIGFFGQYGCIQRQGGTNIAAWYPTGSEALTTLTFPDTQGFDCFEPGDVVQDPDVKVISKTEEDPWQIVVDGGNWATGTDFVADYSDNIDSNQFYNGRPERIYNGLTGSALPESHCSFYANTETTVFNGPSVTVNTTLRVHANSDASAVYKINGAPVTVAGNNYNWGWRDVTFTGVMNTLTITDTYQSSIASIEVDGKQLYDSGEVPNKLVKETSYDTKLTVAGDKDLADMTGATFMSDGTGAPGPYSQTPYKLVTTDIESVESISTDYTGNTTATATSNGVNSGFGKGTLANIFTDGNFEGYGVNGGASSDTRVHTYTFTTPISASNSFKVNCYNVENIPGHGQASLGFEDDQGNVYPLTDLNIADGSGTPGFAGSLEYPLPGWTPGTKVKKITYQMRQLVSGIADFVAAFIVDGRKVS